MDQNYQRKYYRAHRDKRLSESKEYHARHRAEKNRYNREYYRLHKDKWEKRTPEKRAQYNAARRAQYKADPERRKKLCEQAKLWWSEHPEKRLDSRIRKFGITGEDYKRLLAKQGGGCAICGSTDAKDGRGSRLFVDQDHETRTVRGLLCSKCNFAIGQLDDDTERLRRAILYLRSHIRKTGTRQ